MRYAALATDYDGTLARGGTVDAASLRALRDLRRAGWNLVLVTGRHLEILASILPELWLFDRVVAENGAVVAASGREPVVLAPPPPARFLDALGHRGVTFKAGRVMVDTVVENERAVKEAIAESQAAVQLSRNKGSLMVLPEGVDKGSGLLAALAELGVTAGETVGAGDAENDLPFLAVCGVGCACGDALPEVRARTACYAENIAELARRLV